MRTFDADGRAGGRGLPARRVTSDRFDPRGYWEQRLAGSPGREGVGHAGIGEGLNSWMYRVRAKVFTQELSPVIGHFPSRRVLDVGAGSGFFVDLWRRLGAESIVATDIADTAVARLRARFPDVSAWRWTLGEPPPSSLTTQRFGAISAMDVLYHVLDDDAYRRTFETFFDLLEEDGALILTENFLHGGEQRSSYQRSREYGRIVAIVEAAGFAIARKRPLFWLMNAPHDSRSGLHHLWWRGVAGVASRSNAVGSILGAALYGPELVATELLHDGPSTELMLCRRLPSPGGAGSAA